MIDLSKAEMNERLIAYVQDELLEDDDEQIDATTDLIMGGVIDSLDIVHLITFVQNEFDIRIPPMDVTVENFSTIAAITDYIQENL
ncbi:MAG: acyl carrier protein [Phototrophicaceae bacterium]